MNSSRKKQSVEQEDHKELAVNPLAQNEPPVANERPAHLDGNAHEHRPWKRKRNSITYHRNWWKHTSIASPDLNGAARSHFAGECGQ